MRSPRDSSPDSISFGVTRFLRPVAFAMTAVTTGAFAPLWALHSRWLGPDLLLLLAALMVAAYERSTILRPAAGTYTVSRGFWPFVRARTGQTAEFVRVRLESLPGSGEPVAGDRRYAVRLVGRDMSLRLISHGGPGARATAAELAQRLGIPLDEGTASPGLDSAGRTVRLALTAVVSAGIILVGCAGMWPFAKSWQAFGFRGARRALADARVGYGVGTDLMIRGDFIRAAVAFRVARDTYPEWPAPHLGLARALTELNDLDNALVAAEHALKLAPDSVDAWDAVGVIHQRRREWQRAADCYSRVIAKTYGIGTPDVQLRFGETLLAQGRRADAIVHIRVAMDRQVQPWCDQARALLTSLDLPSLQVP